MSDYIPRSDADFSAWIQTFRNGINSAPTTFGFLPADVTTLQNLATDFDDARSSNDVAQAQAAAANAEKDAKRSLVEDFIRGRVARIQTLPAVTDAQRNLLGITVRSSTRTAVVAPTTKPVATVDTNQRLQHTINFVDELTPNTRAKPDGVRGCEIWVKVDGPAPTDPSELKYLATDTRTPYQAEYDGNQGGKLAHYMLRWISTRGETGPWSQTLSATITN
jgi:hypothetical protein